MGQIRGWVVTAAALWLGAAGGAVRAEEMCAEAPMILTLAGAILDNRAALPGLHQRRFGPEAAYMALHYGGMEEGAARVLLADLAAAEVTGAQEALVALAVARDGVEAGLALAAPDPVQAFADTGMSVHRAVIAADDGASYFRLMREAEARPATMRQVGSLLAGAGELLAITADLPDAQLARVAAAAEAAGYVLPAQKLFAGLEDRTAYEAFLTRHPDMAEVATFTWMEMQLSTLRHGTGPMPRSGEDAAGRAAGDARLYAIMQAGWASGSVDFLLTVLNQTGRDQEVGAVAVAYLGEVAEGQVDPVRDQDAAWLTQYRGLGLTMGREQAQSVMAAFDFPPVRLRHYAARADESLDWMLAVEALVPLVAGEAGVPDRPEMLTDGFDWTGWVELARGLAGGSWSGAMPDVAAELLFGAGRWDEMLDAAAALDLPEQMAFWRDVMQRLDRRCDGWTASPGQAVLLGGQMLWRY